MVPIPLFWKKLLATPVRLELARKDPVVPKQSLLQDRYVLTVLGLESI